MSDFDADAFVFFGATGDLARKQVFPALQALIKEGDLDVPIIGVAGRSWTDGELRDRARESLAEHGVVDDDAVALLTRRLHYVHGDYHQDTVYRRLRRRLGKAARPLIYLAIPPSLFETVVEGLAREECTAGARVVLEKPFGRNLASARELNEVLRRHFPENAIYRIDHYLGKEPVQNILYTRFANPVFEPIWDRVHVRSIQITMAEDFGVGDRGGFYDEVGTLRDVVQNHLLQVLAAVTMDAPTGRNDVRDERSRLLKAVRPLEPGAVVRGQYSSYRSAPHVAPASTTETYVAVRCYIDTWRWTGVPVFIRAGKMLPVTTTEVVVEFERPPLAVFEDIVPGLSSHMRFRISPDIAIALGVRVKETGEQMIGKDVELTLVRQAVDDLPPYQRLLGDAMQGQQDLFAREDAVEAQWRIVENVLDDASPLYTYEPGTWGPEEAAELIGADGPWHDPSGPT